MMNFVSYLKNIVIVSLGLGVIPAEGMRRLAQKSKGLSSALSSAFNRSAFKFSTPFANRSPLFRASGFNSHFSVFNQVPLELNHGKNFIGRHYDIKPEVQETGMVPHEAAKSALVHQFSELDTASAPESAPLQQPEPLIKKVTGSGRGLQELRVAFDALHGKKSEGSVEKMVPRRSPRARNNSAYVDKPVTFAQALQKPKINSNKLSPMVVRAKQRVAHIKAAAPVINNRALNAVAVLEHAVVTMQNQAASTVGNNSVYNIAANDSEILNNLVARASAQGYVPFVVEERMLPQSIREQTQVQLLAGSADSMIRLMDAHNNTVAPMTALQNNVIASTGNSDVAALQNNANDAVVQIAYDDTVLSKMPSVVKSRQSAFKWVNGVQRQPLVILGTPQTTLGSSYRVGYMSNTLAQTLFGNCSGLQWIGAFNAPEIAAVKQAVAGIAPLQNNNSGMNHARIEAHNADATPQSPRADHEFARNGERSTNNMRNINSQRNSGGSDFQRNNDGNKNNGSTHNDQTRFHDDANKGGNKNSSIPGRIGTAPVISGAAIAAIGTTPDPEIQDPAVVVTDPSKPNMPRIIHPKHKGSFKKPKQAPQKFRVWTPCQNAVRMYGAQILAALEYGMGLDFKWAGKSRYIADMIKNYNEMLIKVAQYNNPDDIKSLQYRKGRIISLVVTTRYIMNMK